MNRSSLANRPYRFITPLWGVSYVRDFLAITLPSELAEGNLKAFGSDEACYTIVTTSEVQREIETSPEFEALEKLMPIEFIMHGAKPREHAYERMTRAYNLALMRAQEPQTCFFLTADDFYSDGLFKTARTAVESGKRAVMVPTIRVVRDSFRGEVQIRGAYALEGRELVRLMLRHEHPMVTSCIVNDRSRTLHRLPVSTLYRWEGGYVGRWNVMHPVALKLPAHPRRIESTIDWGYPVLSLSDRGEVHIVHDSDDGTIASLSPYSYSQNEPITTNGGRRQRVRNLKDWVGTDWPLNFHVTLMEQLVYLHVDDRTSPQWDEGVRQVDAVWKPFRRYVGRHRVEIPHGAQGTGLELLTYAVKRRRVRKAVRLVPVGTRLLRRRLWQGAYHRARRRLQGSGGPPATSDADDMQAFYDPEPTGTSEDKQARQGGAGKAAGKAAAKPSSSYEPASDVYDHQEASRQYHETIGMDDMDPPFRRIYEHCREYTMTSPERMYALYKAVEYLQKADIAGDFVECGVWRGGSMMVALESVVRFGGRPRTAHLFDTFEGLPEPSSEDLDAWGNEAHGWWEEKARSGTSSDWARASLEEVTENLARTGYPQDRIRYVKGMVEETLPSRAPDHVALLRLDTDWYASTKHELEHLYPRLVEGGVLVVDDYGHYQGARKAVDEYLRAGPVDLMLVRLDYSGRVALKGPQRRRGRQ